MTIAEEIHDLVIQLLIDDDLLDSYLGDMLTAKSDDPENLRERANRVAKIQELLEKQPSYELLEKKAVKLVKKNISCLLSFGRVVPENDQFLKRHDHGD